MKKRKNETVIFMKKIKLPKCPIEEREIYEISEEDLAKLAKEMQQSLGKGLQEIVKSLHGEGKLKIEKKKESLTETIKKMYQEPPKEKYQIQQEQKIEIPEYEPLYPYETKKKQGSRIKKYIYEFKESVSELKRKIKEKFERVRTEKKKKTKRSKKQKEKTTQKQVKETKELTKKLDEYDSEFTEALKETLYRFEKDAFWDKIPASEVKELKEAVEMMLEDESIVGEVEKVVETLKKEGFIKFGERGIEFGDKFYYYVGSQIIREIEEKIELKKKKPGKYEVRGSVKHKSTLPTKEKTKRIDFVRTLRSKKIRRASGDKEEFSEEDFRFKKERKGGRFFVQVYIDTSGSMAFSDYGGPPPIKAAIESAAGIIVVTERKIKDRASVYAFGDIGQRIDKKDIPKLEAYSSSTQLGRALELGWKDYKRHGKRLQPLLYVISDGYIHDIELCEKYLRKFGKEGGTLIFLGISSIGDGEELAKYIKDAGGSAIVKIVDPKYLTLETIGDYLTR